MNNKNVQLYAWIETGKNEEVKNLIKELGVDYVADGGTALNYAALYDNLEIAKFCIENNANVNSLYNSEKIGNYTPLMAACKNGNLEIVKLLISNNADIDLKDSQGFNALEIACNNFKMPKVKDSKEIIKILIENGANPMEEYFDGLSFLEYNRQNDNIRLAEYIDQILKNK